MGFLSDNFISRFFVDAIEWLYGLTGDYVLAVIIFTIALKIILLPLDIKSKVSMNRMQEVAPKAAVIRERYKNDPQKQNSAIRELYKKENVKTSAGCLPLLIQMPILFAMFGAIRILSSVKTVETIVALTTDPGALPHSFMWVHNIWQSDTGIAEVMPSFSEFSSSLAMVTTKLSPEILTQANSIVVNTNAMYYTQTMKSVVDTTALGSVLSAAYSAIPAGTMTASATMNYGAVVAPVLTHYEGLKNGYFLFPALAGIIQFLTVWYTAKKQEATGQPGQGMAMQLLFPAMIVYFSCTTGTLFALYYGVSGAWQFGSQFVLDVIFKKKKKSTEVAEN